MDKINNIFITGGSGFIAPHLVELLHPSYFVTLHVRDLAKAALIKPHPKLRVISGPLTEQEILKNIPVGCDAVIHLAGAVHGPNVEAILDSNIVTTQNVLAVMEASGIPKIIFMSTASVWSDATGTRLSELTQTNPSTLYGYAKLAAERLIANCVLQNKISSAVILRCNNTYGPGGTQGAVANFVTCLMKGVPVQIHGDGKQLREPLYVTDIVDVIFRALVAEKGGLQVYAISGPEAMTVLAMARGLAASLGRNLEIDWRPENPDRARHIIMDIDKARRDLGWYPHMLYEEGIANICAKYIA